MTPAEFVRKWSAARLTERQGSQQHFLDVCKLVEHPEPATDDGRGATFTFERLIRKKTGRPGWADVWKKGCFGWEYKGKHKDLDAAYGQLEQYRGALENPPLLVVSDMDRIIVHTNFTGTMDTPREITLANLEAGDNLAYLKKVFHKPYQLNPGSAIELVTREAAGHVAGIAESMRKRGLDPEAVAHFLDRLIFCLFAEDISLLPGTVFREIVEGARSDPQKFTRQVETLFKAMAHGGDFGAKEINYFNGNLFNSAPVLELSVKEITALRDASHLDWSAVDPSIFGTLFERGLDPLTRAQLRAHYTSREDIELVVEPVVMLPLRREWDQVRARIGELMRRGTATARRDAQDLIHGFIQRLADIRVLDPACGSGNFLYVVLLHLKDLEEAVNEYARQNQLQPCLPRIGPWQLYGIEVNPYAFDLAQMTIWIGHLQWDVKKGVVGTQRPILRPMEGNFQRMDAILDRTDPHNLQEPDWPAVDFIVGNPPWVGGGKMRKTLREEYVEQLRALYRGRLPGGANLCCYWFEKARRHVDEGKCWRAGLLATSQIRTGSDRQVLDRIAETGGIFMAWADRPWVLDGAAVRSSMVGFDNGSETERYLDGLPVAWINTDLTSGLDVTEAAPLAENGGICFQGVKKGGPFDLKAGLAQSMLAAPLNPSGRPNSDVVRRRLAGHDIARSPRNGWVIDFDEAPIEEAAGYEVPFEYMRKAVEESRRKNPDAPVRADWWLHERSRPELRQALKGLKRCIVTPEQSRHRVFVWMETSVFPDSTLRVVARDDEYLFGILQSRVHERWCLRKCSQLGAGNDPRYSSTRTFGTFPFPWPPGQEPVGDPRVVAVAAAARELVSLRDRWLAPPDASPKVLRERTLNNLYNLRPTWLDLAHQKLDAAVFAAYGWNPSMSNEEIVGKLLDLNRERAGLDLLPADQPRCSEIGDGALVSFDSTTVLKPPTPKPARSRRGSTIPA